MGLGKPSLSGSKGKGLGAGSKGQGKGKVAVGQGESAEIFLQAEKEANRREIVV